MTVAVQTPVNSYTSSGATTYVYSFFILSSAHLVVKVNGVTKTETTHYAVTGVGAAGGGTITGLATTIGDTVVLQRVIPLERTTDYQQNGDLLAPVLNPDFDQLWRALQQLAQIGAANTVRGLDGESLTALVAAASRANLWLAFDASGQPYAATSVGTIGVSAYMATVLDDTTAAAARTTLGAAASGANADITSLSALVGQQAGLRNRVINGDMRIDQRNAGAAFLAVSGVYILDRWSCASGAANKLTFQQVADAPTGFKFSTKVLVTAQYAPGVAEQFVYQQKIEGQNLVDFQLGLATAAAITATLWVKGSIAGTYSVFFSNVAANRTYIGTITVATAWAKQTVTLVGDLAGTWATDNTTGLIFGLDLGSGTNLNGAAGAWSGSYLTRTAGSVTFVNQVNGSTLNITGVQIELGSISTTFEQRPIALERSFCQRYYEKSYDVGITPGTAAATGFVSSPRVSIVATENWGCMYKVSKRAAPTIVVYSSTTGASGNVRTSGAVDKAASGANIGIENFTVVTSVNVAVGENHSWHFTADAEL